MEEGVRENQVRKRKPAERKQGRTKRKNNLEEDPHVREETNNKKKKSRRRNKREEEEEEKQKQGTSLATGNIEPLLAC